MKTFQRKEKGVILITVVILMVILFMLSGAITAMIFPEFFFLRRHSAGIASFHLADAGIKEAMFRIEQYGNFNGFTGSLAPAWPPNSPAYGTYTVAIAPDPGNNNDILQLYYITSTAQLNNRPGTTHTVYAVLESSTSFARYLYFTDRELMRFTGSRIWFIMGDQLDGPVHSNDQFSVDWSRYYSYPPIFQNKLTTAQNSINYYPRSPQNENEYKEIFKNGTDGFELGAGRISFPPPTDAQRIAALGGMLEPSSNGVYLPNNGAMVTGGVYVRGEITDMNLKVDGNGNQDIEIKQTVGHATRKTTVTLNPTFNTTTIKYHWSGQTTTYQGIINGVVYSKGDVDSLQGTVGSKLTLVTDPNYSVDIKGHIRYKDDPRTNPSATNVFGIVSGDIVVDRNAPSNLEIDASLLAGNPSGNGSFYYEGYNQGGPKGNLTVLGGLAQQVRGPVGTFYVGGGIATGYRKNYIYDTRLGLYPPPFYPTTGKLRIRFWEDRK